MPYKNPETARLKNNEYSRDYRERRQATKTEALCSVPTCGRPRDSPLLKKCSVCLAYMRKYKKAYRAKPRKAGTCNFQDCPRPAALGKQSCVQCRGRAAAQQSAAASLARRKTWRDALKETVMAAYGAACKCCGEAAPDLLTVDHIEGYTEGPRGGTTLYGWLRTNNYPPDFRVLCMMCNYALGHHGYCSHSDLTQVTRTGRPRIRPIHAGTARKAVAQRAYMQALKLEAMNAYGGAQCACGEAHLECLSLDHINDDGATHRRQDPKAKNLYTWLRQRQFPPGYRVLCINCNYRRSRGLPGAYRRRAVLTAT